MNAGAAAQQAAIANAIRASGVLVRLQSRDFLTILGRVEAPLVVHAMGGFFGVNYQYLTSYKGLTFFTKSDTPLPLPHGAELVLAKKIWVPN